MGGAQNLYLLLDSEGVPLARAKPQGAAAFSGNLWQLTVLDDEIDLVLEHKQFKLMSITDAGPTYEGTLVRSRGDTIQLEVRECEEDDDDLRKNLRVPASFKSFIYPLTGAWSGRRPVESHDLSCGGIAFFTRDSFQIGEQFEIVIPVTSEPLVVKGKILRVRSAQRDGPILYAAKFVDLCQDEETLLRESVFSLQLSERPKRPAR